MSRNFAILILSHGRANNVKTVDSMLKAGYTGKYYIIIDDEDKQIEEYQKVFGKDRVIIFNKDSIDCDTMDNFTEKKVILFSRNVCFTVAKDLGLTHFLELDDDYMEWCYRYYENNLLKHVKTKNLDQVIEAYLDFLDESGCETICMAQGGDFIGGTPGNVRKSMNTFFCRTDRVVHFKGRINEDVNAYSSGWLRGEMYFTYFAVMINQMQTQANNGGMTDVYLDNGTYVKSFYSVVGCPACVKIGIIKSAMAVWGSKGHARIHHRVDWDSCAPRILDPKYRNTNGVKKDFIFGK